MSEQSENETEDADEVKNKSDLVCTSLLGCALVHCLLVPSVLTGEFILCLCYNKIALVFKWHSKIAANKYGFVFCSARPRVHVFSQ